MKMLGCLWLSKREWVCCIDVVVQTWGAAACVLMGITYCFFLVP